MKVMIVVRWPVGGIRTYIEYLYQSEYLKGNDYILVTPDMGLREYFSGIFSADNFDYIECQESGLDFFKAINSVIKKHNPDVVHSHGSTAGVLTVLSTLFKNIPHVVTMHDVFFEAQYRGLIGKLKKFSLSLMFKKPNIINPCGYEAADNFKSFFTSVPKQRVKPIRNGIDVGKFSKNSIRDLRSEAGLSEDTVLFGFFGRFMSQKGFDLLVKMFSELPEERKNKLHVACFGWGGFIREEQENIESLGLMSNFTFFDHTEDMPAALRGVDIAVMPSRWEACPLLPMEALCSGAVVVASDCVGMHEVCVDTPARMFKSGSHSELSKVLLTAVDDIDDLKLAAKKFSDKAITLYDSKLAAQQVASMYQDLTDG